MLFQVCLPTSFASSNELQFPEKSGKERGGRIQESGLGTKPTSWISVTQLGLPDDPLVSRFGLL